MNLNELQGDSDNRDTVQVVDTDVGSIPLGKMNSIGKEIIDSQGNLIYFKKGTTLNSVTDILCQYNGKKSVELSSGLSYDHKFDVNMESIAFTKKIENYTEDLYYISLSEPQNVLKLASNVENFAYSGDKLFFESDNKLYVSDKGQKAEKIAGNINDFTPVDEEGTVFYYVERTIPYVEFVKDSHLGTVELQETLETEEIPIYDLYLYKNGTSTKIDTDILAVRGINYPSKSSTCPHYILYKKLPKLIKRISISDITEAREVYSYVMDRLLRDVTYQYISDKDATPKELNFTADINGTIIGSEDGSIIALSCYDEAYKTSLYCIKSDSNTLGEVNLVTEVLYDFCIRGNKIVYYKVNDSSSTGNLYYQSDGQEFEIIDDINLQYSEFRYYKEDDTYTMYKGEAVEGQGQSLLQCNSSGEQIKIDDNVKDYKRIDKNTYLYIKDSALYLYDEGEKKQIRSKVQSFFPASEMEYDTCYFGSE